MVSNNSTSRSDAQKNPVLLGWFPHFLTATVSSNAARKIPELGMRFIAGKIMELNKVFSSKQCLITRGNVRILIRY